MKRTSKRLAITRVVANHLLNPNHSNTHRFSIGISIMTIGVLVAESALFHGFWAEVITSLVGHGIEATGVLPFVKIIEHYNGSNI